MLFLFILKAKGLWYDQQRCLLSSDSHLQWPHSISFSFFLRWWKVWVVHLPPHGFKHHGIQMLSKPLWWHRGISSRRRKYFSQHHDLLRGKPQNDGYDFVVTPEDLGWFTIIRGGSGCLSLQLFKPNQFIHIVTPKTFFSFHFIQIWHTKWSTNANTTWMRLWHVGPASECLMRNRPTGLPNPANHHTN